MSYPAKNQLISYRRTAEGLDMEPNQSLDAYAQSRTLTANRGSAGEERMPSYPDVESSKRAEVEQSLENEALLTPRDRALQVVSGDDKIPYVDVVTTTDAFHQGAPTDRFGFVFFIMLIHGFGTLLPWNVLISSPLYWNYKLTASNTTDEAPRDLDNFLSDLFLSNQVPNVLLNGINLFVTFGGSLTLRIVVSIAVLILIMLETLGLATVNSSLWVGTFVIITLISAVVMGTANGIYQNSLYGLAASFPPKYTNAIIIGNNFCGTLVALMGIMSLAVFSGRQEQAGILYFACALAILLVAFATYFLLPRSRFYRYYTAKSPAPDAAKNASAGGFGGRFSELWFVLKQNYVQCWNVFFTFFVTLSVFPSVAMGVRRVNPDFLDDIYFHAVVTFLNFGFFAFLGNLIPFACVQPGPKYVWIPVLLRVLFIPFFLFCNFMPDGRALVVLFANDYVYTLGITLLALTSGYFSSLTMMYASSQVKDPRLAPIAGQLAAFFLVLGIFLGLMSFKVIDPLFTAVSAVPRNFTAEM